MRRCVVRRVVFDDSSDRGDLIFRIKRSKDKLLDR